MPATAVPDRSTLRDTLGTSALAARSGVAPVVGEGDAAARDSRRRHSVQLRIGDAGVVPGGVVRRYTGRREVRRLVSVGAVRGPRRGNSS